MPNSLTRFCLVALGAASFTSSAQPHPVPKLADLIKPWIFVRASEASTLFIDEKFKGREPYGHLIVSGDGDYQWLEFDGEVSRIWNITKVIPDQKQLTFTLQAFGNEQAPPSRLVIYPFRDIDHCLVMIRFDPGAEENPVRFTTPYHFKTQLPYAAPEGT